MRVSITLDAGVFAIPTLTATRETVYGFVEALLGWSGLARQEWATVHMADDAHSALFNDGRYPAMEDVKRLFQRCGIVEYSANDVGRALERLMRATDVFEEIYGLRDVLLENDDVEACPDLLASTVGENLRYGLARCMVLHTLLKEYCSDDNGQHVIAVQCTSSAVVRVRARLCLVDHSREDLRDLPLAPSYIEGDILTSDSVLGVVRCLDEMALLRNAADDTTVRLATGIAVLRSRESRGNEVEWDEIDGAAIGREFRESAQRCCRDGGSDLARKVLRAVAETLDGNNLPMVHALRVGRGATSAQKRRGRDQARAWRRSIDNEYRLHYWELTNGRVELAQVGPHNEFDIPE